MADHRLCCLDEAGINKAYELEESSDQEAIEKAADMRLGLECDYGCVIV